MKQSSITVSVLTSAVFLAMASAPAMAWDKDIAHEGNVAYVQDSDSDIVRDSWGGCVRTIHWTEALATEACGAPAKAVVAVAKPAPVIAPAPAPAVVAAPVVVPVIAAAPLAFSGFFQTEGKGLTSEAKAKLDTYVEYLNANPAAKIEVSGHADSRGSASFNQNLSEQRADAVKNYLESQDIDSSRISTTGFGESNPVGDNMTAAGRAENRRVELTLVK